MREINITRFFHDESPGDYSASVMELGPDAGRVTWQAAMERAAGVLNPGPYGAEPESGAFLPDDESRDDFRQWARGFGAWSREELESMSPEELESLLCQFIAGDIREAGLSPDSTPEDWAEYQAAAEQGTVSGRIWRDESGSVWFSMGD